MDKTPEPFFNLWVPAIEAGILKLPELVAWADAQILELTSSPAWLVELSLATDLAGVMRAREALPTSFRGQMPEKLNFMAISIEALYVRYEAGQIQLQSMLMRSGEIADAAGSTRPDCEAFYTMLNELGDHSETPGLDHLFRDRLSELYTPMAEIARLALPHLNLIALRD